MRDLRDLARERGMLSAAITAEVKRGQLQGFYVKQIATCGADEFSRMTNAELEAFIRDGVAGLDASRRAIKSR